MFRLLKYDFKRGTMQYFKGYLCAFMICLCSSIYLKNIIADMNAAGVLASHGTIMDYYMYAVKGMETYVLKKDSFFQIPVYWFCYHVVLAYIIGSYTQNDFAGYAKNTILATKTRIGWWGAKCFWCTGSVILYYIMGFAGAVTWAIISHAQVSLQVTKELMKGFGEGILYLSNGQIILVVILLPCLVSIGISLLQILISLRWGSVAGFACICILYILSVYYTNPFMIGNYTMWRRDDTVCIGSNIHMSIGVIYALLLITVTVIAGMIYVDEKDIL